MALKRENPDRTAAQVVRILRASTGWAPSESTLLRLFHRRELMGPAAGDRPVVFGRFEAAAPNERWVGDALHGPRVGGRKIYLFAFLDDHSRLAVGYRFGFAEDTVRLAAALQPALAARGVPGSRLCRQRLGLRRCVAAAGLRQARHPAGPLHPAPTRKAAARSNGGSAACAISSSSKSPTPPPKTSPSKGMSPAAALLELNALFTAWVETVYHHQVHSETGQTPLARWDAGWDRRRARPGHARRRTR